MSDVSFQEEQSLAPATVGPAAQPWMIRAAISTGLAKDEQSAQYVLLGVAALAVIAAIAFASAAFGGAKPPVQQFQEGQNVLLPPAGAAQAQP